MTATTWARVHLGDTVRGADQRAWEVVGCGALTPWALGGAHGWFRLRLGDRELTVDRPLDTPVELVDRADHTDMAAAAAALIGAGLGATIIEETPVVTTVDQFSSPAAPVKRDRWGRYVLPDPTTGVERSWTRVSTVARTIADEYNLTLWKLRQVARGMALRPDLVAGAAAADPDTDKRTLDEIAGKAMERAGSSTGATLGTALHSFTQRLDMGEPFASLSAPANLEGDLRAYGETQNRYGLGTRPEWIERIVVLPELGVAGTFDRVVEQPPGVSKSARLSVLDLKTGKDLSYGWLEIAIQQAFYANAPLMWNPTTGTYEPMPAVDRDRALVLHLPVGKAHGQLYGVNLIEGWEYARLALQVRAARSAGKGLGWLVEPQPDELALHNVSRAADRAELARLWELLQPRGLWTDEVNAAATARLAQLEPAA